VSETLKRILGSVNLVEVSSRPPSLKSDRNDDEAASEPDETDNDSESDGEGGIEEDEEVHDARSIKSFESMLSGGRAKRKTRETHGRKSLTDRLTHMSGLSRRTQSDMLKVRGHVVP
jgi:hypothetical protein